MSDPDANRRVLFETFANAEALAWDGTTYEVAEAGDDVSRVDGRHLKLESPSSGQIVLHERLVAKWSRDDECDFVPVGDKET